MKKNIKNNSGFTLVEMIIAAGLAGLVALVGYTTLRSSQSIVGTSLATAEVTFMKNQMIAFLGIPENCERNFGGKLVQSPTSAYIPFLEKRSRTTVAAGADTFTWDKFIEVNKYYGEGSTKTMLVKTIESAPNLANPNSLTLTVHYDIRSTLKKVGTSPDPKFSIELFIVKDNIDGSTVRSCATDVFTMITNAIKFSCKGNGATYNPGAGQYGTCTHNNIVVQNEAGATVVGSTGLCPAGEFLYKETTLDGDAPGPIQPNGSQIYKCRKFTTKSDKSPFGASCPANTFMKSVKANGEAECVDMADFYASIPSGYVITQLAAGAFQAIRFSCPGLNEVMTKMNANGIPTCVPKQIVGSCPVNQYIVGINNDGTPKCAGYPRINGPCAAGQYVKAVNSDGSIAVCEAPTLPASGNCNTGDYVINYLYGDGSGYCVLNN